MLATPSSRFFDEARGRHCGRNRRIEISHALDVEHLARGADSVTET